MDSLPMDLRLCPSLQETAQEATQLRATDAASAELDSCSDAMLIELFKNGSKEAMDRLYSRYRRLVLSTSLKILRNHAEAEDIVQDVFLEVCKRAELFDPARGSVRLFILQYAYSRSLDRRKYLALRHSNGHSSNGNGNKIHGGVECDCSPSALDILTFEERRQMIGEALGTLSPKQREVFRLICSQGLLIKEIADQLGETEGNVRHYYHRGLKKLRQELWNLLGQNGK
jgi:RNA polymerase sigma-70 factor (ECF subfamily)